MNFHTILTRVRTSIIASAGKNEPSSLRRLIMSIGSRLVHLTVEW